jgi:signal transduction histidine kinase
LNYDFPGTQYAIFVTLETGSTSPAFLDSFPGRLHTLPVLRAVTETVLIALAVLCHAAAGIAYGFARASLRLPETWSFQYYSLLAVSLSCSIAACAMRKRQWAKVLLVPVLGCLLLVSYPMPSEIGIQILLGMPLILLVAIVLPRPDYLVVDPAIIVGVLLMQRPAVVWGVLTSGTEIADSALSAIVLAAFFVLSSVLKEVSEGMKKSAKEIARLDIAIDSISDINASFQNALVLSEEESVRKERDRITREIHDIVGYALTNQQMMLEAALMLVDVDPERLRELLTMARDGVAEGLKETRKTLYELRRMDEFRSPDFNVILKVARNFETVTGVRVAVDFTNAAGDFDQRTWAAVYRLIQESMINSFRHGKAKSISIQFREEGHSVYIVVRDDGSGSPILEEGIGLKGMRERIDSLRGDFFAGNAAGGFVVTARLPKAATEGALR